MVRQLPFAVLAVFIGIAGQASTATGAPAHIVIIFLENKSYTTVASHYDDIPYLKSFAEVGVRFTNYREGNSNGPSLPDYLQVAAGSSCGATSDVVSAGRFGSAEGCPTTVWNQLEGANVSWGVYMDAMPSACSGQSTYANAVLDTPYAMKHNPVTPFASIWGNQGLCKANVLPGKPKPTGLPAVAFAAPGICDDLHGSSNTRWTGCLPKSAALYRRANDWLTAVVPPLLNAGATVLITFDESGVLYAAEVGPGIAAGSTNGRAFTHYSVLAAIEDAYGLPLLGGAETATPIPLS